MRPASGGMPPQSMVQECLNRTAGHLWGIISNGSVLRLLRADQRDVVVDLVGRYTPESFLQWLASGSLLGCIASEASGSYVQV